MNSNPQNNIQAEIRKTILAVVVVAIVFGFAIVSPFLDNIFIKAQITPAKVLASGTPTITSTSPTFSIYGVKKNVRINGTNLTGTVQFAIASGQRYTVAGVVNDIGTQITVAVPEDLPAGNGTVRVYANQNLVSNELAFKVKDIKEVVSFAKPTSVWSPQQTINGWWPELSPDGRYVAYGNWGESWITDLKTKKNYDFSHPAGLPNGASCYGAQWYKSNIARFVCELPGNQDKFSSYTVKVGEWVARKTADDPSLAAGNQGEAQDGHWASYLAKGGRIAKDNRVLATNVGGAVAISGNYLIHACTNENNTICIWNGARLIKRIKPKTNIPFGMDIYNNYISFGLGHVTGIDPKGREVSLATVSNRMNESSPKIFPVKNSPWVVTQPWNDKLMFILLRPWGDRASIAVEGAGSWISVVYVNNSFVVAYCSDKGALTVKTIPASSPRTDLIKLGI